MSVKTVKVGDKVTVHYTGKLDDGRVFDSSKEREPLEFTVGSDQLIAGFDTAVVGMQEGAQKIVTISPHQAYGEHDPELVKEVDRKYFPPHLNPEAGQSLRLGEGMEATIVTITAVDEEKVVLDANHPLAGSVLTFEIELVKIH
ncbi:MAG: peptidylprolyl isomerase [Verrucomicrobia bacterium]|nr:peptidylprolyl isomerase [Verrucomicrobiota bacterium]